MTDNEINQSTSPSIYGTYSRARNDANHVTSSTSYCQVSVYMKEELWYLLRLAIPITVSLALQLLPATALYIIAGMTDSKNSVLILAAFSIADLFDLMFIVDTGIISATSTFCSQTFGSKRMKEFWLYVQASVILYILIIPFQGLVMLCSPTILSYMGKEEPIASMIKIIIFIHTIGLPLNLIVSTQVTVLRAQNIAYPYVLSSIIQIGVAFLSAYILGFHTSLGYIGVALATKLGMLSQALVLQPFVMSSEAYQHHWIGWNYNEAKKLLPRVAKLGISSMSMLIFLNLGYMSITILAGYLPDFSTQVATNGVLLNTLNVVLIPLYGIEGAGSVRLGNALGAKHIERTNAISANILICLLILSIGITFLCPIIIKPYFKLLKFSDSVKEQAMVILYDVYPVFIIASLYVYFETIFLGAGKQLYMALINAVCSVFGIALGAYLGLQLNIGLLGLWYGRLSSIVLAILLAGSWFARTSWESMIQSVQNKTQLYDPTLN